jgi:hypothetical protein
LGDIEGEVMAKTSGERQRNYRERRRQVDGDRRQDTWISAQAYSALERLSSAAG